MYKSMIGLDQLVVVACGLVERDSDAESEHSKEENHGWLICDACSGHGIGEHVITLCFSPTNGEHCPYYGQESGNLEQQSGFGKLRGKIWKAVMLQRLVQKERCESSWEILDKMLGKFQWFPNSTQEQPPSFFSKGPGKLPGRVKRQLGIVRSSQSQVKQQEERESTTERQVILN